MKMYMIGLIISFFAAALAGCQMLQESTVPATAVPATAVPATAVPAIEPKMVNSKGEDIGSAVLKETEEGVLIQLSVKGMEPGEKAVHIHETGVCTPPDFESAGGHFNPAGKQHGFQNPKGYHAGDLPNLKVDDDGTIDLELTVKELTLEEGSEYSLLDEEGSAIVIHEGPDDYKTDPAGNSGARIACGTIKR